MTDKDEEKGTPSAPKGAEGGEKGSVGQKDAERAHQAIEVAADDPVARVPQRLPPLREIRIAPIDPGAAANELIKDIKLHCVKWDRYATWLLRISLFLTALVAVCSVIGGVIAHGEASWLTIARTVLAVITTLAAPAAAWAYAQAAKYRSGHLALDEALGDFAVLRSDFETLDRAWRKARRSVLSLSTDSHTSSKGGG